jgi:hypothetical protein
MRDWLKLAGFLVFASALSLTLRLAQGEHQQLLLWVCEGALLVLIAIVQFGILPDLQRYREGYRELLGCYRELWDITAEFVQATKTELRDSQRILKNLQDALEQTNACVERIEVNTRRRGRPRGSTRWSPERIDLEMQNLARWLERGYTLETFAQSKGIDVSTLRRYRREWCERKKGGG